MTYKNWGIKIATSGCNKDKGEMLLFDKNEVAETLEQCIKLYDDDLGRTDDVFVEGEGGPGILKAEIEHAIQ